MSRMLFRHMLNDNHEQGTDRSLKCTLDAFKGLYWKGGSNICGVWIWRLGRIKQQAAKCWEDQTQGTHVGVRGGGEHFQTPTNLKDLSNNLRWP